LESDFEEMKEGAKYFQALVGTHEATKTSNLKFENLESKLAESNAEIRTLVDEKNALEGIVNKTEEQNARLLELSNKIVNSDGFSELRTSPEVQEVLKKNIKLIKIALEANNNSKLFGKGILDLEAFMDKEASKYLVLNPKATDKLPAVQQADNAAAESILESMLANRTVLDSRIGSLGGVSSGDMMETYGAWAKGSFTQATQKAHGGSQGYKLDSKGITIGIDTGDESLVGIAYSFFKNDVKNKTVSKNKEDITSHTISAYGKYVATPEIFISGQGQFGIAEIKKKRATGDLANNIATAKPKATTLGAKAEIGYDYAVMEGVHLIPAVGISYADVKVKGYKESGSGLNRKVGKINASRTSGIASLTAKYFTDMGSMKLVPEIHANVDYAFNSKNGNTVVTLIEGLPSITTPSKKLEKGRYNVGAAVKAIQSERLEFSAGYDFGFAKKFQSHTGTLKVKFNF
jgi:outer membrane autotransporter protein